MLATAQYFPYGGSIIDPAIPLVPLVAVVAVSPSIYAIYAATAYAGQLTYHPYTTLGQATVLARAHPNLLSTPSSILRHRPPTHSPQCVPSVLIKCHQISSSAADLTDFRRCGGGLFRYLPSAWWLHYLSIVVAGFSVGVVPGPVDSCAGRATWSPRWRPWLLPHCARPRARAQRTTYAHWSRGVGPTGRAPRSRTWTSSARQ